MTSAQHGSCAKRPLASVSSRNLLSRQVVEREDEAPVEVSFTGQRVVVDVRLLSVVVQAFQPPEANRNNGMRRRFGPCVRTWGPQCAGRAVLTSLYPLM